HGALAAADSTGIFMTNFRGVPDAIQAEGFRNEVDLVDYHANVPPLELVTEPRFDASGHRIGGDAFAPMGDEGAAAARSRGLRTTLRATLTRSRFLLRDVNVLGPVEADEASLPTDGPGVVLKLPNVPALLQEGKKYGLAIEVSRTDAAGNV